MSLRARLPLACALALCIAPLAQPAPAMAASHATSADARALLDKAVSELQTAGAADAFTAFNKPDGAFHQGELYVFAFTLDGVWEAYGANPELVGQSALDLTDAEGHYFVREIIALARTKGQGRIRYVWLNRADNRVEHKWSLIRRVGDHIVGVGYYTG